eukprot:6130612-Pyramimonas_sp.AAC.1
MRRQLRLDANSMGLGDPKSDDVESWMGAQQLALGIAPSPSAHVAKRAKGQAEIETARQKAKAARGPTKDPPPPRKTRAADLSSPKPSGRMGARTDRGEQACA